MAARYLMDRDEVLRLLGECKILGCIDTLDSTTDRVLFAANAQSEAEAMLEVGGPIALWHKEDNSFVAVADLVPMDGATLESFAKSGKPYGIPIEPTVKFAGVSLVKAFSRGDDVRWKKMMRLGGCRVERVLRTDADLEKLIAKFGGV